MDLNEILRRIVENSGMSREQIQELIEQKKAELGGLITDEGAAFIVARELGVEPLQGTSTAEEITTSTLAPGMLNVNLTGRVLKIYRLRSFERDGETNVVQTLVLGDKDGTTKLVLWGPDTQSVTEGTIKRGSICRVIGGYVRKGLDGRNELHKGRRGRLQIDPKDLDPKDFPDPAKYVLKISELTPGEEDIDFVGRISEIGPLRTFTKKDGTMGHLSWLTIDDETGSSRLVFWNERAEEVLGFQPGDIIRVEGAYGREGLGGVPEAHLGRLTRITQVRDEALVKQLEKVEHVSHGSLTIQEIRPGRQVAEVIGKIAGVGQSRQFTRKDGSPSQVMNFLLIDQTGMIRAVLWGDQVQSGEILRPGDIVQITNANARSGRFGGVELHLGDRSALISNPKDVREMEFDPPVQEINQIRPETGTVNIKGKLLGIPQSREFTRDDGSEGRVASVDVADTTGVCRVVAWGNEVEKLVALEEHDVIQVIGGSVREGRDGIEIHLSELSALTVLEHEELDLGEITQEIGAAGERTYHRKPLKQIKSGDFVELRATVVKIFDRDPTYMACPQCLRKVRPKGDAMECNQHGEVDPIHHMIFSMILDDGSANIRATLGGEVAEEFLQLSAEEAHRLGTELGLPEAPILREKQRLEGQELIVCGRIRPRRDRDELDLMVDNIQTPNPEDELEKLLKVIPPE